MRSLDFSQRLLVSRFQGALPVILTAPHGGDTQPPGVPKERSQKNVPDDCRFEKKNLSDWTIEGPTKIDRHSVISANKYLIGSKVNAPKNIGYGNTTI